MLHAEWLLLLLFVAIVLLFVGCSSISVRTPMPNTNTSYPLTVTSHPLLPDTPVPRSTLPPRGSQTSGIPPGLLLDEAIRIEQPRCFSSPNAGYLCLGRIWNDSQDTLSQVMLSMQLSDRTTNTPLQTINQALQQQTILPEQFAPYHVIFTDVPIDNIRTDISIIHLQRDPTRPNPLRISAQRGFLNENGRYIVTATLHNISEQVIEQSRVIVTVSDNEGRIVGYRVYLVEEILAANATKTVRMEVIPQILNDDLVFHIAVEVDEIHESP